LIDRDTSIYIQYSQYTLKSFQISQSFNLLKVNEQVKHIILS